MGERGERERDQKPRARTEDSSSEFGVDLNLGRTSTMVSRRAGIGSRSFETRSNAEAPMYLSPGGAMSPGKGADYYCSSPKGGGGGGGVNYKPGFGKKK